MSAKASVDASTIHADEKSIINTGPLWTCTATIKAIFVSFIGKQLLED
jgi:hypothetical protein